MGFQIRRCGNCSANEERNSLVSNWRLVMLVILRLIAILPSTQNSDSLHLIFPYLPICACEIYRQFSCPRHSRSVLVVGGALLEGLKGSGDNFI